MQMELCLSKNGATELSHIKQHTLSLHSEARPSQASHIPQFLLFSPARLLDTGLVCSDEPGGHQLLPSRLPHRAVPVPCGLCCRAHHDLPSQPQKPCCAPVPDPGRPCRQRPCVQVGSWLPGRSAGQLSCCSMRADDASHAEVGTRCLPCAISSRLTKTSKA